MYVDIKKKDDQLEVSSPLSMSPYSAEGALKDMEHTLKVFKRFVHASKERPGVSQSLIYIEYRKPHHSIIVDAMTCAVLTVDSIVTVSSKE